MNRMIKAYAVISGLTFFICVSCQQSGHNATKSQNPIEEYTDTLLKAKKAANDAARATEQNQENVKRAINEIDKEQKDK